MIPEPGRVCVVCGARPPRSRAGRHPVCGSCASQISRLARLDVERARSAERQAMTRIKRIVAARLGVAALVERLQRVLSDRPAQP